jgi:hypothetical protein
MQSEPASVPLLLAARTWLLEEVVPHVDADKRYDALLIASAMAIVARELEADVAVLEQQRQHDYERLRALLPGAAERPEQPAAGVRELGAWLVRDIRAGRFDEPGAERDALRRWLRDTTVDNLKNCNPRYLELEESS